MASILLITQDDELTYLAQEATSYQGHYLHVLNDSSSLTESIQGIRPDLVMLDLARFGETDIALCRRVALLLRPTHIRLLCIVPNTTQSIATALDAGADDCVRRPTLNPRELSARTRALLRRLRRTESTASLVISSKDRTIRLHGQPVELTPTEFTLLDVLSRHPGEYVTASELLTQVWKYPPGSGDTALVRNHVRNLRRKLEVDPDRPRVVTSAHGRGYTIGVDIQRM
ncbi:MAG: MtrAB system response regulator MtrA [Anaerolineae bacterium]